jgi:Tfp pilus assembly protein PilE
MNTPRFSSLRSDRSPGFTLVEIMVIILIMSIIVAIATPAWIRARSQSRMKSCQENLSKLDGAKEQWALEHKKLPGTVVSEADLVQGPVTTGYMKFFPTEPSGGSYVLNVVGDDPECSTGYPGHHMSEIGLTITELEF